MTSGEFKAIGEFIQSEFGIKMPRAKKIMLQSRLTKRLRAMNMASYREYQEYLFSPEGLDREVPHMIDVVTTNKTDFFREPSHFELLRDDILPNWLKENHDKKHFTAWSAGCATGEEPYSLAMVLGQFARQHTSFRFEVLGTDISGTVLEKGRKAIYPEDKTGAIPSDLKKSFLLRSKNRQEKLVRVTPELRKKVNFQRLNLLEEFPFQSKKKDVIFCRNVIIYFEKPVQEELFRKCCHCLKKGGYLFIGHSETLSGMRLPLRQKCPTVYERI